jgi:PAS domain S-box-containing protein
LTGRRNPASPAAPAQHRHARTLLALLPPIVALFLQWMLWPIVQPSIWFLLYPAIFFSSWLGGWRISIAASAVSAVVVLWAFIPPERTFIIPAGQYLAASIFFATGVVFGVFNDRLRRANRRTVETLAATERANDALRQAIDERRVFTALIENSSDFIGIAEPTGKPIYLNPAGRRMMGLPPDHPVESMTILDCYSDDQRAFASDVILKAMVEKGHWQGETSFRHWQTGEAIPVSDTHFMIREPETDRLLGMGTVTRDISELKRARDEAETA